MAFKIRFDQIDSIRNMVDRFEYKSGDRIAFVEYNGIKNIPIYIRNVKKKTKVLNASL